MTDIEFLSQLRRLGVRLSAENNQLRVKAAKGKLTADLKREIGRRKPALLTLLTRQNGTGAIPAADRAQRLPLSFAQQRLWLLQRIEPTNTAYNEVTAHHIWGALDVAAFERAVQALCERHELLRTAYCHDGDGVYQIIAPSLTVPLTHHAIANEREVEAFVAAESAHQFDLAQPPLWRMHLLRLTDAHHILVLNMHHIVGDAWAGWVLLRDLFALQEQFATGRASSLAPLEIQYADYAVWQRQQLTDERLEQLLGYWQAQLAGAPPLLELPTDRPRPTVQSQRGARHYLPISAELTTKLQTIASQHDATLFMVLQAAYAILLGRYARTEDVVIGTPIANRRQREVEPLIGFFANVLVLRADLSGNPPFSDFLQRVRTTSLVAYKHQDAPFELLVERLQPERNLSYTPIYQAAIGLQNLHNDRIESDTLRHAFINLPSQNAKFDLTLDIVLENGGLVTRWEYKTDLFDAPTIERMAGHFENVLRSLAADVTTPIMQLGMLSSAEKHQLLHTWNDTAVPYPHDETIIQLFEAQVERTPSATAIAFGDQQLTYQQFNRQVNQLAHQLMAHGVTADTPVVICLERSVAMVVAIYAILKAGGAYVPIEPTFPVERIAYMLENAQPRLVLTRTALKSLFPATQQLLCVDSLADRADASTDNPPIQAQQRDLAYILYTSGSTGRPKGVAIPHAALYNQMRWIQSVYPFNENDRLLQRTPFSFDASVWEFFAPLLVGGTLVVAPPFHNVNVHALADALQKSRITVMQIVPSLLQLLVEHNGLAESKLRRLFVGGEALSAELVKQVRTVYAHPIVNLYGPTEVCINSVVCEVGDGCVHIGRPIHNIQAYILDEQMQPVPIGVVGELYLAGRGVARGYWNRPELSAERFVSKDELGRMKDEENRSFILHPSSFILYKTGDLCRYLPDSTIDYIGRNDFQVKLRGLRIELGEIERIIIEHPRIQNGVVVVREMPTGKQLVAYIVTDDSQDVTAPLHDYLSDRLPAYMLPSYIVRLQQFPLTTSGKINRRALPLPAPTVKPTLAPPETAVEQTLAALWQQVLQLDAVGIDDNFFEIGGHSLLVIQLHTLLGQQDGAFDVPITALFQYPTIRLLAQHLTRQPSPPPRQPSTRQSRRADLAQRRQRRQRARR